MGGMARSEISSCERARGGSASSRLIALICLHLLLLQLRQLRLNRLDLRRRRRAVSSPVTSPPLLGASA